MKKKDIENHEILALFLVSSLFNVPNKDFPSFKKLAYEKIMTFASKHENVTQCLYRNLMWLVLT